MLVAERVTGYKGGVFDDIYQFMDFENNCPTLLAWVKRFRAHPPFKDHIIGLAEFDKQNAL